MDENNAIVSFYEEEKAIVNEMANAANFMYSSFNAETLEDKKRLYNAMSRNDGTIKGMLNQKLIVTDVIVTPSKIVAEETGEVSVVPRTVLVTVDGKTYTASSWGLYRSVQKINALFGGLHFDDGIAVIPKEVKTKKGFTLILELA